MPKPSDLQSAKDVKASIARIISYVHGLDYDAFLADNKTFDAVIRNIEIIGEAVKNLSAKSKSICPSVDWKGLAGMRDKLIHSYFGVNTELVWDLIIKELPEYLPHISLMIDTLGKPDYPKGKGAGDI